MTKIYNGVDWIGRVMVLVIVLTFDRLNVIMIEFSDNLYYNVVHILFA